MYITNEEYKSLGGGYDIADPLFSRLEYSARMEVDKATFNRLVNIDELFPFWQQLRMLMVELINYAHDKGNTDVVVTSRSTSQGGVSQSESYAVDTNSDPTIDLIQRYLANVEVDGVNVLYRGCGNG